MQKMSTLKKEEGTYTTCDTTEKDKVISEGSLQSGQPILKRPSDAQRKVCKVEEAVIQSKELEKLTLRFESLLQRTEKSTYIMKLDEYIFCLCLLCLLVSMILQVYRSTMVKVGWIFFMNFMYLSVRAIEFKWKNWSYYFFDFPHLVSMFICFFLSSHPNSLLAYLMLSASVAQPIISKLIVFDKQMIFKDRDSLTVLFMHYSPLMVFLLTRFYRTSNGAFVSLIEALEQLKAKGFPEMWQVFGAALGLHAGWMAIYYLLIFLFRKESIEKFTHETLTGYNVDHTKIFAKSMVHTSLEVNSVVNHFALHLIQTVACLLASILVLNSYFMTLLITAVYFSLPIAEIIIKKSKHQRPRFGPFEGARKERRWNNQRFSPESFTIQNSIGQKPRKSRSVGSSPIKNENHLMRLN